MKVSKLPQNYATVSQMFRVVSSKNTEYLVAFEGGDLTDRPKIFPNFDPRRPLGKGAERSAVLAAVAQHLWKF